MTLLCLAGLGLPARAGAAEPDPDEGDIGIQLLEAPANRRSDPRALRYIVDHLPPGTIVRRNLLVANRSDRSQRFELYPAAASVEKQRFVFAEGRAANELTSWISLDRTQVNLGPGENAKIRATVSVPPAASTGERYAVIWAAVKSRPKPSANVNQIHRVGVRVYLDIGLGGEPPSEFTIGELTPARDPSGEPSVTIGVDNTGGRALDMGGKVSLSEGPAGMRAGPFDVAQGTTLAPGETGTVSVRFPRELPNGPWKIDVALESGMVRHSASGSVTFPKPGQVGRSSTLFSRLTGPWGLIGTSLAVGLLIVGGLVLVIRRNRRASART